MRAFKGLLFYLAAALTPFLAVPAWARAMNAPAFMPLGTATAAPAGFIEFCASHQARSICTLTRAAAGDDQAATFSVARLWHPSVQSVTCASGSFSTIHVLPPQIDIGQRCAERVAPQVAFHRFDVTLPLPWMPCGTDLPQFIDASVAPAPTSRLWGVEVECKASSAVTPAPVSVPVLALPSSREASALLRRINERVNGRVRQQSDEAVYGVTEKWQRSGTGRNARGDCEDMAIEKRLLLIDQGYPPEMLAFGVVYSRDSGLHTVLLARTDKGDVVLDSRTPYVQPWSRTTYSWVTIQSMDNPLAWRSLAAA